MKHLLITLLLFLAAHLSAQTPEQFLAQGRAFLASQNISNAHARFSAGVALFPNHELLNAFQGATTLLSLHEQPASRAFLDRLGFSSSNRNIYAWESSPATDTNDVILVAQGLRGAEFTAVLNTNIIPAIRAAANNFAKVVNTNILINLSSNETTHGEVTIDYGDILLVRSFLHFAEYLSYTISAQNLDVQLDSIRQLFLDDEFTIESVLVDYPNLLTFATTNNLVLARSAFVASVDLYQAASDFIRHRPLEDERLFNADAASEEDEATFRQTLAEIKQSLNGITQLSSYPGIAVYFGTHFSPQSVLRRYIPKVKENSFVLNSWPDPTFGGLILGVSSYDLDDFLSRNAEVIPAIGAPTRGVGGRFEFLMHVKKDHGYIVESSTDLVNWEIVDAFIPVDGRIRLEDDQAPGMARRFFRLVDADGDMPPPSNDSFANAEILELNTPASGYTVNASRQEGEPSSQSGSTVWYRWTSSFTGIAGFKFDASSGSVSPRITVYQGSSLNNLTPIAGGSVPSFQAVQGTTYFIRVESAWAQGGFQLTIGRPPQLTVSSPVDNLRIVSGSGFNISATGIDLDGFIQSMSVGIESYNLLGYRSNISTTNSSLSLSPTNLPPGRYVVSLDATDNAGFSQYLYRTVYIVPTNDAFASAMQIPSSPSRIPWLNVGATTEQGEIPSGSGKSVWFKWVAPRNGNVVISLSSSFPSELGLFSGNSLSNLQRLNNEDTTSTEFQAVGGTTYYLSVDGYRNQFFNTQGEGDFQLSVTQTDRPVISFLSHTNNQVVPTANVINFTFQITDADGLSSADLTYYHEMGPGYYLRPVTFPFTVSFTNPVPGNYTFNLYAADVYNVSSGTQFVVRVSPVNDNFVSAISLSGPSANVEGSNLGATREVGEDFSDLYSLGGKSVWYRWTANANGNVWLNFQPQWSGAYLGVLTGSSVTNLAEEAVISNPGSLNFEATAGTTYQVVVDSTESWGSSGEGNFSFSLVQSDVPSLSVISPTNNQIVYTGESVAIQIEASDSNGIRKVEVFSTQGPVVSDTSAPYTFNLPATNFPNGYLYVVATDNLGVSTKSADIWLDRRNPPPINDNFANRILLQGSNIRTNGTNVGATPEPDETYFYPRAGRTVWYEWIAGATGTLSIEFLPSWSGSYLGVYQGNSLSSLTYVNAMNGSGILEVPVSSGSSYEVVIDSTSDSWFGTFEGTFELNLQNNSQ